MMNAALRACHPAIRHSTPPCLDLDPALNVVFRSQRPPDSAGFRFSPDGKSIGFVIEA
jgi:hypothetical protein